MRVVYFQGCEWEGLYLGGRLVMESHSLDVLSVLTRLAMEEVSSPIEVQTVSEHGDWLMDLGTLPSTTAELFILNKSC